MLLNLLRLGNGTRDWIHPIEVLVRNQRFLTLWFLARFSPGRRGFSFLLVVPRFGCGVFFNEHRFHSFDFVISFLGLLQLLEYRVIDRCWNSLEMLIHCDVSFSGWENTFSTLSTIYLAIFSSLRELNSRFWRFHILQSRHMDTSAPSDNAFPSSGGALITGNETERTREFKDVVPVLLKRMMDADGIRPSMIRSGPVLVNGKKLERGNRGAVLSSHRGGGGALKLLDKQGEQGGGFVEDDACSTSGKETGKSFWKALDRCIAASIKGFVIGGGLRGGLSLFAILSRLRKRSSFRWRL